MAIRRARYSDMEDLVHFMALYHQKSRFKDIPFVRKDVVKVIEYFISSKDSNPLIAVDDEGKIRGLLFATLEPFFFNSRVLYATDLQFISTGYGMQLLGEFKRWAFENGADRIIMGVSSSDPRADQFLQLSGSVKTGNMYVFHNEIS